MLWTSSYNDPGRPDLEQNLDEWLILSGFFSLLAKTSCCSLTKSMVYELRSPGGADDAGGSVFPFLVVLNQRCASREASMSLVDSETTDEKYDPRRPASCNLCCPETASS